MTIDFNFEIEILDNYPIFNNKSKFELVLVEIYNENIHGNINENNNINNINYLLIDKFYPYNYYSKNDLEYYILSNLIDNIIEIDYDELLNINQMIESYNSFYYNLNNNFTNHKIIRNYRNIINNDYIKPEIGLIIELNTGHRIVILKTFWIKIIQRTWKNIYKRKKYILNQRKKIFNLNYRLINGNWIRGLNNIPSLKGMLYKLNNKK